MSVRISNTQIKFKDEDGTYKDVNAISPEIPVATSTSLGVVKAGVSTVINSAGAIEFRAVGPVDVKGGTSYIRALTPEMQHASAFYGLAKAAGVNMASSSNAIGEYTDEAKIAIQKMLGIYEPPWELIREDTFTNTTEANHDIDVDANGEPFELSDVILMFETPKQSTYAAKGTYGQVYFYYSNSNFYNPEPGAWEQPENTAAHAAFYMIEQRGGLIFVSHTVNTTATNSGALRYRYGETFKTAGNGIQMSPKRYFSKIRIWTVTGTGHYILYGKRKWQ